MAQNVKLPLVTPASHARMAVPVPVTPLFTQLLVHMPGKEADGHLGAYAPATYERVKEEVAGSWVSPSLSLGDSAFQVNKTKQNKFLSLPAGFKESLCLLTPVSVSVQTMQSLTPKM